MLYFDKNILPKGETVMKAKFTAAMILSAMLLTACQSDKPAETEQESQTVSSVTTASETEAAVPEKTTVTTSETTEETTATAETEPPKIENISENVELNIHKIDVKSTLTDGEYSSAVTFFANNIAAKGCFSDKGEVIRFLDMNDMTVKASVTAPDDWAFDRGYCPCIKGGGDVLCKIPLIRFNNDKMKSDYAVILVYNDFTTELMEGEPREIFSFPAGSHSISDHPYDIFDADSGEVIVEGFDDAETGSGFGNMSLWYDYNFQIDNDRFVYRTCGIEWMPSFGYYDFTEGKAVDLPDSRNFMPVGYYNGKIYAEETCWDGNCQGELYTFDIETLEKKHFMSSPVTVELNDYTEYSMSPSGKYIAANYYDRDNENYENSKNIIFIISPDSGEVLTKCELKTVHLDSRFEFIDDNRFTAFDDNTGEIYIFDVKI